MTILKVTDRDTADGIMNLVKSKISRNIRDLGLVSPIVENYTVGTPVYGNDNLRVTIRQTIEIEINITPTVRDLISNSQGSNFLDHSTRIDIPDVDDNENSFNYNNYSSDAFSYYNLRYEEYENYSKTAEEKSLPNFLIGALFKRSPELEGEIWDAYSMFQTKPVNYSELLVPGTPINNYEFDGKAPRYQTLNLPFGSIDSRDYFKVFFENRTTSSFQYIDNNQHVYVDYKYTPFDSEQIGNCPFFNRIRLPRKTRTIQQAPVFATESPQQTATQTAPLVFVMQQSKMTDMLLKTFRQSNSFLRSFSINNAPAQLKVYDLLDEVEGFDVATVVKEDGELFLRTRGTGHLSEIDNPFLFYFYKLLSVGKIRNLIKSNILSFDKLLREEDHIKEHIGFKVVKRRQGRTSPIQTFYFLGQKGLQDFIDTQIRFDTVYTYDIIGMFAVYGSNYSYENFSTTEGRFKFDFVNTPSLKVVEVPMASHTLRVVEPPPIVPDIRFYNEKTSKNKLKIRLEHQAGNLVNEYNQKPMREFGNNADYISRLKQYFSSDDILIQSGKTSDGTYEIYRVEEPPMSYKDFEGNLIATAQSSITYPNGDKPKSVMFVDNIKHQKKYYYMFRVLTHQGNPSETSEIYEIEMYEDADETFLLVIMYNFPDPDYYDNEISMRKYLQIIPNFEHAIINESNFSNLETANGQNIQNIRLGLLPAEESLWTYNDKQKKYIKLRLESKNSGRKLDLNLLFKINKPTN